MTTKTSIAVENQNRENGPDPEPDVETVFKIIKDTWDHLMTKPGIILISAFLLIMIWGPKGIPIFHEWFAEWIGTDPVQAAYRTQLLSYASGLLLGVVIPFLIIKFRFRESLSNYGLGLGNIRLGLVSMAIIIVVCLVPFYFGAKDESMMAEYPMLYQGLSTEQIKANFTWGSFLAYQLIYASFFFVIEFTFRGYLLFGLREKFGLYAVLTQMLSYTAWHLPKPVPELLGTPVWGFAVAAVSLRCGSMWYAFLAHWLLNVYLDIMILVNKGII